MSDTTQVLGGGTEGAADGVKAAEGAPPPAADAVAKAEGVVTEKAVEKTPEQQAAEKKTADDAAAKTAADAKAKTEADAKVAKDAAEKAWAEFKPKRAEGIVPNEAALKKFLPLARELGLNPEATQKLISLNDELEVASAKERDNALTAEVDGWTKELKSDKELGGEKWDASMKTANKAFEKFAPPELKAFLKATGLHAHPALFRTFHAIGKAIANDSISGTANGNGAGAGDPQAALKKLYTHPTSQQMFRKP